MGGAFACTNTDALGSSRGTRNVFGYVIEDLTIFGRRLTALYL